MSKERIEHLNRGSTNRSEALAKIEKKRGQEYNI